MRNIFKNTLKGLIFFSLIASVQAKTVGPIALVCTAGTVTLQIDYNIDNINPLRDISIYTVKWISASGGTVITTLPNKVAGILGRIITFPDLTAAPSIDYDVELLDDDKYDVLIHKGANQSSWGVRSFLPLTGDGTTTNTAVDLAGYLKLSITNAGSGKKGTLKFQVKQ